MLHGTGNITRLTGSSATVKDGAGVAVAVRVGTGFGVLVHRVYVCKRHADVRVCVGLSMQPSRVVLSAPLKPELGGCSGKKGLKSRLTLQSRPGRVTIYHVDMLWTRFCRSP